MPETSHNRRPIRHRTNRIIPASEVQIDPDLVRVVGGDGNDGGESAPAVIIEKYQEQVRKILVQCPCGRHAEILCEYDE